MIVNALLLFLTVPTALLSFLTVERFGPALCAIIPHFRLPIGLGEALLRERARPAARDDRRKRDRPCRNSRREVMAVRTCPVWEAGSAPTVD